MNYKSPIYLSVPTGLLIALLVLGCLSKPGNSVEYETLETPVKEVSMQPYLLTENDTLYMTWTEDLGDGVSSLLLSSFARGRWTERVELVRGSDWFVNWADFPAISKSGGNLVAHYLKKSDSATYAYDIQYLHSTDRGKNWSEPVKMHADTMKAEHGFVSFSPMRGSNFATVWLDGRNSADHAMQLRFALIDQNGRISHEQLVDRRTCDCCQTSLLNTSAGLLVAYRDRSDKEVRDIYVSVFRDSAWSEPKPVHRDNWEINGCPVNGPKLDGYDDTVGLAWFTAADDEPKVKIAFSDDGGLNFNEPIRVDEGRPAGRVDVAMLDRDKALVSWIESNSTDAEIRLSIVDKNSGKVSSIEVSQISGARATGFPQFEILENRIYMAWNEIEGNKRKVKLIRLDLEQINP